MQVIQKGSLKNVPMSVKKLAPVLDLVRGKQVDYAIQMLRLLPKKGGFYTRKLIKSVVANVEHNKKMSTKDMVILNIWATKGKYYRRMRFGAKGRVKPYKKYHANIFIEIGYGS